MDDPVIKRVMYLSRASHLLRPGELEDLLLGSRKRNLENGITGLLVYDAGAFAQVLEGPPESVDQLLHNIRSDPRHTQYEALSEGIVSERYFVGWAMDWANLEELNTDHHELRRFMSANSITDRTAVYRALLAFAKQRAPA